MATEASERRKTYHKQVKQGNCPRCGAKKGKRETFTYCNDCREYFRNYNDESSVKINKKRKSKYNERKKNNQCPRCGVKLGKRYPKILCPSCLEKQYGYNNPKKKPVKAKKR
jgi:uncharacterized Zn finger protein (UPF0148 family)